MRWCIRLQQSELVIQHQEVKNNTVPDLLSRATEANVSLFQVEEPVRDLWYRRIVELVRTDLDEYSSFCLEGDRLYRKVRGDCTRNAEWKIVVPKELRTRVPEECHDASTADHFGNFKTRCHVMDCYYWPKLLADVVRYVAHCQVCQRQKPEQRAPRGLMGRRPEIFQLWQLIFYHLMKSPKSKNGHTDLLVMTDYFSKMVQACPLRKANANNICRCLEEDIFLKYSVLQVLICDYGTQFASNRLADLAERLKFKISFSAKYHPQNNLTERSNGILKTRIRSYLSQDHCLWDKKVPQVVWAMNTAPHEVTRYSHFFLNFYRAPIGSGDQYGSYSSYVPEEVSRDDVDGIVRERNRATRTVKDRLRTTNHTNKKYYDRHR